LNEKAVVGTYMPAA